MSKIAEEIAATMSDAIDAKYPNQWVILLMDTASGLVDAIGFEKTDEGKLNALDMLLVSAKLLPIEILVFTNVKA